MQIIAIIANQVISNLALVIIYAGVICGSVCTYATLKIWNFFPLLVYLMFPVISAHIFLLVFLFTNYADICGGNVRKYLQVWKRHCIRKQEHLMLQSCPKYGVKAGTYGMLTAITGLQICDDIIQNTVTLLLCFELPQ